MFCYGLRLLAEKISSLYIAHAGYVKNKEALTRNIAALLYRIQFCEICFAYEPEVYCYSRYTDYVLYGSTCTRKYIGRKEGV